MAYPASLQLDADHQVARWRPLVHWLLVIPHGAIAYSYALWLRGEYPPFNLQE